MYPQDAVEILERISFMQGMMVGFIITTLMFIVAVVAYVHITNKKGNK